MNDMNSKAKHLEFVTVCCVCNKIRKSKGKWGHTNKNLEDRSKYLLSHGYCPHCAQDVMNELEKMVNLQ